MVNIGELEKCIWKELSEDEGSTSFDDAEVYNPELLKCKHYCDGYDLRCKKYVVLSKYKVKEYE